MLLLPLLIAIVACDNSTTPTASPTATTAASKPYSNSPEGKPPGLSAPVPDPVEATETKPAGQLPSFISQASAGERAKITAVYQGAIDHYDAYSQIPCYCGCAVYMHAHMSLAQCYVQSKGADGAMTFTNHSLSCDICQGVAKMTVDGLAQKTPLKDVRAAIFTKFKYTGIWTDTPFAP
jgi:hypothetical protein